MTVYIVVDGADFEGSDVSGVYSTKEKAIEEVYKIIEEKKKRYGSIYIHDELKDKAHYECLDSWRDGFDYVEICEYKIDEKCTAKEIIRRNYNYMNCTF